MFFSSRQFYSWNMMLLSRMASSQPRQYLCCWGMYMPELVSDEPLAETNMLF